MVAYMQEGRYRGETVFTDHEAYASDFCYAVSGARVN